MYKHVLVATDGSRLSAKAVAHAIELAQSLRATLTGFYACPDYPLPAYSDGVGYEPVSRREYSASCKKEAERILGVVGMKAESAGLEFKAAHAIAPAPWAAILAAAKRHKCEVIVMASHGRSGVSALLLGSETQKVLAHSKLPVLVVR